LLTAIPLDLANPYLQTHIRQMSQGLDRSFQDAGPEGVTGGLFVLCRPDRIKGVPPIILTGDLGAGRRVPLPPSFAFRNHRSSSRLNQLARIALIFP
jgi:hypothetical protein